MLFNIRLVVEGVNKSRSEDGTILNSPKVVSGAKLYSFVKSLKKNFEAFRVQSVDLSLILEYCEWWSLKPYYLPGCMLICVTFYFVV
jgi:hypothetical protein